MHGHAVHMRRDAHPAAQGAEGLVDDDQVEAGSADAEAGGVCGVEARDVAVGISDEAAIDADKELHIGNGDPLRLGVGQGYGAVGTVQAGQLLVLELAGHQHVALDVDLQGAADGQTGTRHGDGAASDRDRIGAESGRVRLQVDHRVPVERCRRTGMHARRGVLGEVQSHRLDHDVAGDACQLRTSHVGK